MLAEVFTQVLPYIRRDKDKLSLVSTCRELRKLLPQVVFTEIYQYDSVCYVPARFSKLEQTLNLGSEERATDNRGIITYTYEVTPLPKIPDTVTRLGVRGVDTLNNIPKQITHLILYDDYSIDEYLRIPDTIRHLYLTFRGWSDITVPDTVTYLTISCVFVSLHLLPSSIKRLTLDPFDRVKIVNLIPKSVTHLTFGVSYRGKVPVIGENVTYLKIRCNMVIREHLWVTHLTFKGKFNNSIEEFTIPNVTHLSFYKSYNQPIQGLIPPGLVYLRYRGTVYRGPEIDQFRT